MDCTHRWIVESPRDARKRWESTGDEQKYKSVCKFCNSERDFDVPKEDENQDSMSEMSEWKYLP